MNVQPFGGVCASRQKPHPPPRRDYPDANWGGHSVPILLLLLLRPATRPNILHRARLMCVCCLLNLERSLACWLLGATLLAASTSDLVGLCSLCLLRSVALDLILAYQHSDLVERLSVRFRPNCARCRSSSGRVRPILRTFRRIWPDFVCWMKSDSSDVAPDSPSLFDARRTFERFRQVFCQSRPNLCEFGRTWPGFGLPQLLGVRLGQDNRRMLHCLGLSHAAGLGGTCALIARQRLLPAGLGAQWEASAPEGELPLSLSIVSRSAEFGPNSVKLRIDQIGAVSIEIGPCRPNLAHISPNLDEFRPSVAQVKPGFDRCGQSVRTSFPAPNPKTC